jgi:carboxylesterase type B
MALSTLHRAASVSAFSFLSTTAYVKTEIKAFGGDPTRVTLAGQSSGGELVKTLLVTPSATSLFTRAILQSAPLDFSDQAVNLANTVGKLAKSTMRCHSLLCFTRASLATILSPQATINAQGQSGAIPGIRIVEPALRPVVDGKLVTRNFKTVVAAGDALEGPAKKLLSTTVKNEAALGTSALLVVVRGLRAV